MLKYMGFTMLLYYYMIIHYLIGGLDGGLKYMFY